MKRKILALLLSLIYIAASLPAFAADEPAEPQGLDFFRAFGIAGDEVNPTDALTRYELTEIYYKLTTGADEVYPSDYDSKYFLDIDYNKATSVDYVYALGLMNGVGGGMFYPTGTVNYNQLIKTLVSFLGYDVVAQSKGGYPSGYTAVANQIDIDFEMPANPDVITWQDAENAFLSAVNSDMAVYLNEKLDILKGVSYLEHYRQIKTAAGVVTADNYSDMDNNKSEYYGFVKINSVEFAVLEGAKDILKIGGRPVNVMYRDGGRYPEIIYFEQIDSKEVKIMPSDLGDITDSAIKYWIGQKEYTLKYNINTEIIYNGSALATYSTSDLNPFDTKDGYLICIDNDEDGILDAIYVNTYEVMVVGAVMDGVAYSKFGTGQMVDLAGLDEGTLLNADGNTIDSSLIEKNDVLCYETDRMGKITKVTVVIDTGDGIIEGIKMDSANTYIESAVIKGETYYFAKSARLNPDRDKLRLGTSITFYFGIDKTVADFEINPDNGLSVALITDYALGTQMDNKPQLKIFNDKSKFEIFNLAEKVKINDASGVTTVMAKNLLSKLGTESDGKIKRQLVKYSVNENNEINKFILPGGDDFFEINILNDDGTRMGYKDTMNTYQFKAYTDNTSVAFVMPKESEKRGSETLYSVEGGDAIGDAASTTDLNVYNFDSESPLISYALLGKENVQSNVDLDTHSSTRRNYFYVTGIQGVADEDGAPRTQITGFGRGAGQIGKTMSLYLNDESLLTIGGKMVEPGDIVKFSTDGEGIINQMKFIIDVSEARSSASYGYNNGTYPADAPKYTYGKVKHSKNGFLVVEIPGTTSGYGTGSVALESYPLSRFTVMYEVNSRKGEVTSIPFSAKSIYDSATYGDKGSDVFIFTEGEWWIGGIIINYK